MSANLGYFRSNIGYTTDFFIRDKFQNLKIETFKIYLWLYEARLVKYRKQRYKIEIKFKGVRNEGANL